MKHCATSRERGGLEGDDQLLQRHATQERRTSPRSTRDFLAMPVFDQQGRIVSLSQKEHEQIFPRPGWVEHDPREILRNVIEVVHGALDTGGLDVRDLVAVGIANQRETTVVWDPHTGEPVHNAIVWQDTRTDALCRKLGAEHGQDRFRDRCGLPLATYFSGPKVSWLLDSAPGSAPARRAGRPAVRNHGQLARLESHRSPRHRRDQRQPDDAHEPRDARLG